MKIEAFDWPNVLTSFDVLDQDEVEKDVKVFRASKHSKTKKTLEKFQAIQKELQQTVAEVRNPVRVRFLVPCVCSWWRHHSKDLLFPVN